ncbi:hypothetical protein BC834DRAFT_850636 [Gloeopeniophorella convolvens]|nr:hypothetical protein BC834DRAFT_850636 [Gloeopeniophorella convolvens]
MSSSRYPSPSPSPVLSPASSPDSFYDFDISAEDASAQIISLRKRPSVSQLSRLQSVFEASRYITKEDRRALAEETGLDVKFITIWFQNRRQSDKRKAWTRRDRAKKKENTYHRVVMVPPKPKSAISLDQAASRSEQAHMSTRSSKPRMVLASRKHHNHTELSNSASAKTKALWMYMPSSPPGAPSSPVETPRTAMTAAAHRVANAGRSLEWACAKARAENRHRNSKVKRTRSKASQPSVGLSVVASESESGQAHKTDSDEGTKVITPTSSRSPTDSASTESAAVKRPQQDDIYGKPAEDVEAALVLLQFLKGR